MTPRSRVAFQAARLAKAGQEHYAATLARARYPQHPVRKFHPTVMSQNAVTPMPETPQSTAPRILAAFVIGVVGVFAGALMYSGSQQRFGRSGFVNTSWSRQATAPMHTPASTPNQSAVENSTGDQQQQTAAKTESTQSFTSADSSKDQQRRPQTLATALGTSAPAGRLRREHVQERASQNSVPVPVSTLVRSTGTRYPVQPTIEPTAVYPQPALTQQPKQVFHPNMPAAPQNGSVAVAQSTASVLPQEDRELLPPQAAPHVINVQIGTSIRVRLAETLSSDRSWTGDTFRAVVDSPVVVNGSIVAPSGATVLGRVANARKAPLIGGRAELALTLTDITTDDGRLARIATEEVEQAGARSGIVNTARMATGAAVGAVMGALNGAAEGAGISSSLRNGGPTNGFMATKRTVVLPAGTEVVFRLSGPLKITEPMNR